MIGGTPHAHVTFALSVDIFTLSKAFNYGNYLPCQLTLYIHESLEWIALYRELSGIHATASSIVVA